MSENPEVSVRKNETEGQYEILVGEEVAGWLDTSHLAEWGQSAPLLNSPAARAAAVMLAALNVVTLVGAGSRPRDPAPAAVVARTAPQSKPQSR